MLQLDANSKNVLDSIFSTSDFEPVVSKEKQAQEAWLKQRWGKFTSSEIHRLMTNGKVKGELSVGAKTYIREKAAECMTPFVFNEFSTEAMEWGKAHELEAIEAFEAATGLRINHTGEHQNFILSECGQWGGTPDGLTRNAGVEVKCPNSSTHLLYLGVICADSLKDIESKYYWQIQSCMQLTGKNQWYFISYDPRFFKPELRLHYCVIERNQTDIDLMLERIDLAVAERDRLIKQFTD